MFATDREIPTSFASPGPGFHEEHRHDHRGLELCQVFALLVGCLFCALAGERKRCLVLKEKIMVFF